MPSSFPTFGATLVGFRLQFVDDRTDELRVISSLEGLQEWILRLHHDRAHPLPMVLDLFRIIGVIDQVVEPIRVVLVIIKLFRDAMAKEFQASSQILVLLRQFLHRAVRDGTRSRRLENTFAGLTRD